MVFYVFDRTGRRVGRQNLRRFLPDADPARVLREGARIQAVALLDALWSRRLTPGRARACLVLSDEVKATINGGKPIAGLRSNAYLIFDYQGPDDFKFAGVNISIDKIQMGYRDAAGWHVVSQTPSRLKPNQDYALLLAINGLTATLVVNGTQAFSHAFAPRIDPYGFTHGLNEGMVGIGANNSVARIDNVNVQILYPEITFQHEDDFSDGLSAASVTR